MKSAHIIDFWPARESILEAHLGLRFEGVLADDYRLKYISAANSKGLRLPSAFATACWLWNDDPGARYHVITFGEALADRLLRPNDERLRAYALCYYHHEKAHSLHTVRNIKSLAGAAERRGVPFSLVNLLEDARIEALERSSTGRRFGWLDFEEPVSADSPDAYFLSIIQADGDTAGTTCAIGDRLTQEQADRVRDYYYPAALACAQTWGIVDLGVEWIREFGVPPSGGAAHGDLTAALEVAMDDKLSEALEAASISLDARLPVGAGCAVKAEVDSIVISEFSTGNHLKGGSDLDMQEVERLTSLAQGAFPRTQTRVTTQSPTKRLVMRNVVRELDKVYRRKESGIESGKARVVFMLDCSGSMGQGGTDSMSAHAIGCMVIAVLSRLAISGKVEGHVILTGCTSRTKAICQTFALPMSDGQISSIHHDCCAEGFASAMTLCAPILKKADLVLAYTDGSITDSEIDRRFWHKHGIHSIGLYCGNAAYAEELGNWFDSKIARDTPEGLIDALAQALRKWASIRHTR